MGLRITKKKLSNLLEDVIASPELQVKMTGYCPNDCVNQFIENRGAVSKYLVIHFSQHINVDELYFKLTAYVTTNVPVVFDFTANLLTEELTLTIRSKVNNNKKGAISFRTVDYNLQRQTSLKPWASNICVFADLKLGDETIGRCQKISTWLTPSEVDRHFPITTRKRVELIQAMNARLPKVLTDKGLYTIQYQEVSLERT